MTDSGRAKTPKFTGGGGRADAARDPAPVVLRGATRWSSDDFLDTLRQCGDEAADRCAVALSKMDKSAAAVRDVFARMTQNDNRIPDDAPLALVQFFNETFSWCDGCRQPSLPAWVDRDRIIRGQFVFDERLIPSVLALLCKSLPEGYAAAGATKILNISGELLAHTYHRLMGTLQLLVNVSSPYSFERAGAALLNAQQMRLLHAGVRSNVAPKSLDRPGRGGYKTYLEQYGIPINQEDLLATIMAFSLLVVRGLDLMHIPITEEEKEDFYYVWRVFAHLMGIHPPGDPMNESHLPRDLAEAEDFYEAYCRRHYAGETRWIAGWHAKSKEANPDGCMLAARHLAMLGTIVPRKKFRLVDLGVVAHLYVEMMIGEEGCARVGIRRVEGHFVLKFFLVRLPNWWADAWSHVPRTIHATISTWFLRSLLQASYQRGVVFTVPSNVEDLKALVQTGASKRGSMTATRAKMARRPSSLPGTGRRPHDG